MLKSLAFSLAALAATAAAPALAQDTDTKGYTGLYVGGSFGYGFQSNDLGSRIKFDRNLDGQFGDAITTSTGADAFSPGFCHGQATSTTNLACNPDRNGVEYMGRVGFDVQRGPLVIGIVGEAGRTEIYDSVSAFSTTPAFYTMTRSLKVNAAIRARAGYTPNSTTLFYATGGGAYGRVRNDFATSNTANSFTTNGSQDDYGYSAGGGVEQRLGKHFAIGMEYIYTSLKDKNARVRAGAGTAPATNPFLLGGTAGTDFARADDNFRWHSIRATASFRF